MNEQIKNTEVTENTAVETPATETSATETSATETSATETTVNEAAPALTAKEVFDQIAALQRQMMDLSYNSLYRMTEAVNDMCGDDTFESDECREGAIGRVTAVFMAREENYKRLLSTYEKMYSNLVPHNNEYREDRREFLKWVTSCVASAQPGVLLPDFDKIWQAIR